MKKQYAVNNTAIKATSALQAVRAHAGKRNRLLCMGRIRGRMTYRLASDHRITFVLGE